MPDTEQVEAMIQELTAPSEKPVSLIGALVYWCGPINDAVAALEKQGFLYCDGREVEQARYSKLWSVLKDAYGYPGLPTRPGMFRLPDFRGRAAIGAGQGFGLKGSYKLGAYLGAETHQLSVAELPAHTHRFAFHDTSHHNTPKHVDYSPDEYGTYHPQERETHATGGNQPHNNMQPSVTVNVLIRWR
ncbi:tail fiber protein [Hyphomicrobium sp.]|uniref:phage tail protein n=1 Tax=Hyphomicrobium sp. TaxID=82 RepID=UPI0025B86C0E|nr:tail fiber protein [Hyphomicrobium sp.]MCC7251190.1 tail fiber protein [Hyphomicrobium sp.]